MIDLWRKHVGWRFLPFRQARTILENTRNAERREAGLAQQLCPKCGIRPPRPGHTNCSTCHAVNKRWADKRKATRLEAGLCVRCGGPRERAARVHCDGCLDKAREYKAARGNRVAS